LDRDAAGFVRAAPPVAFLRLTARAVAVIAVVYAAGLAVVVLAGSDGHWDDARSVVGTMIAMPWCGLPLGLAARGHLSWVWASAAVILAAVQTTLFLPAYGFGVVYAPIALAGVVVAVLSMLAG